MSVKVETTYTYKCERCDRSFTSKKSPQEIELNKDEETFDSPDGECWRWFVWPYKYKKSDDCGERDVICPTCEQEFLDWMANEEGR